MELKKKKVVYIISNINKALAFEWIAVNLDKSRIDIEFILLNPEESELGCFLKSVGINVTYIKYNGKRDLLSSFFNVYKALRRINPDVIHTHLFDASLIGLVAGKFAGISKRIFTRHHGNQHHVYHPKAVFYDKVNNFLASTIIAPSLSVKKILTDLENVPPAKVKVIHHGFDLTYFSNVDFNSLALLKEKYNSSNSHPVIGVISRYTELKGLQYVIPAFKQIVEVYPDALLVLANAGGDYNSQIQGLLQLLNKRNYVEIPFEQNISALYHLFDVFIHAPLEQSTEAFGQTYIEALAAGVPSVFTLSGVANEFIRDKINAYVVPYKDSNAIFKAVLELLTNYNLINTITEQGVRDVMEKFDLSVMINALETLYEQ